MSENESEAASVAVLAEKPSVARDIARVLGAGRQGQGYVHGNGYIVTWAVGHLVSLAEPHEIRPEWKQWRRDRLPMLPKEWPLVVYEQTKDQFEVVRKILTSPKVKAVVCATDAGREGELIFRYIYEASHCEKPFRRLWISSLTPDAIRKGFEDLKPGEAYNSLAEAARGRACADWLVGMNLSRAYTLAFDQQFSVGRVQTPTLAMLVERELAIRAFVPEDYLEVLATFDGYQGIWFNPQAEKGRQTRLPPDGEEAGRIVERARTGQAAVESLKSETQRMAPPLLYDLTELQRHANRLYGFSAQKTLELAQALYERHKLLSYPRTDSRHLSKDVAHTLPAIVRAIQAPYRELLAPGTGERPLGRRFVDDAKVSDHHALIPTVTSPGKASLSPDERRIYDLVCRRLLQAWHSDHVWSVTNVVTAIVNGQTTDRYQTTGSQVLDAGWKVLDVGGEKKERKKKEDDAGEQKLPPDLKEGRPQTVNEVEALRRKTRPPKRFTDATLLTAMETAGKTLDEKELSDAMKETGLGTPATRAQIIEVLLKRGYIVREAKSLAATAKGIQLIEVVHPEVKSPVMTGQWEAYLKRIHRGAAQLRPFLEGIENYVREVVGKVGQPGGAALPGRAPAFQPAPPGGPGTGPPAESPARSAEAPPHKTDSRDLEDLLHARFGFVSFRPNQEAVCRAVAGGEDVLLVMPTGSGKSLCYQLPGIARGGATLVISPLISLMEDQVAKLNEQGFRADRIHSGRDRGASRETCLAYLNGSLDFLYIAPERLRVHGFPEMLAKRKPVLIAIDEAHCISQWGHDFRPDYRMIGQYLPLLRPAPVVALTATATRLVQSDILEQLALPRAARFIHGFRRRNIAIEVVEAPPSERAAMARELLRVETRRPAIVYAPTRRQTDALASELRADFPAGAYHAGLDARRRDEVQTAFQDGTVEVIVATIAFGMGIDKADIRTVIHTALPGSIEAYYQEIGRAGRDGAPSRAILMHSYADRYTHDYFHERDYPDPDVLQGIYSLLGERPLAKDELEKATRLGSELFDKALEKLWIHGGAVIDYAENVSPGVEGWRELYVAQEKQKLAQLEQMLRFAESDQCRMLALVRHFGDTGDREGPCGICDFCAPAGCVAQSFRSATGVERAAVYRTLEALKKGGPRASGRLHRDLCPAAGLDRDSFELTLGAMARAGLVTLTESSFEKDGKRIDYRTVQLTAAGRSADESTPIDFVMKQEILAAPRGRKRKRTKSAVPAPAPSTEPRPSASRQPSGLETTLRAWRLAEAKKRGVPAFRVLTDKTLRAIASARPASAAELLAIPGIGLSTVERYGAQIFRILERTTG